MTVLAKLIHYLRLVFFVLLVVLILASGMLETITAWRGALEEKALGAWRADDQGGSDRGTVILVAPGCW
jgi:hypothetical protein